MTEIDEYAGIPGMPSDDAIRAELLRTSGPAYWRPFGTPDGSDDLSSADPVLRDKALAARMNAGPGPNGTPAQQAMFEHRSAVTALENEEARLMARLLEAKGFNPETGEPISALSTDAMTRLTHELSANRRQQKLLNGPAGQQALDRKINAAVQAEKAARKRVWLQEEARKRAQAAADNEEIERLAQGYRKGISKL